MADTIKTAEEHFRDWESNAFGFGYGTGEDHTIPAVKRFLALCDEGENGDCYSYDRLEHELGPIAAWLLINAMARLDITEYGVSTRYAWLTKEGRALREFVAARTAEELINIACDHGEEYVHCSPDACNCGPKGYQRGVRCQNPFWPHR